MWTQPSTFTNLQEINNKNVYAAVYGGAVASAGYNGLSANANFLYYYDGANLAAYNKATGTLVATTATGLVPKRTGGIAVDDCNRIYLGGNGAILTYSFNGTTFSTLTPISLSLTLTNQVVFDVKLNRNTQTLFVCGSGFVGTYPALGGISCPAPLSLCIFSQAGLAASTSSITCATLGSATVTPSGGMGPFTYTWLPSNQTGNVGTGLSPGTYTILVYDVGYNATYVTTTTFLSAVPLTGSLSATSMLNCASVNNGTAAILNLSGGSGNQSYLWTNGINTYTTSTVSGLNAGNYSVTVTDALTGCVFSPTFTILQPFLLSSFIIASTPTACIGASITLTGITSGGIPSYTFSWTPGINSGPGTNTLMVSQTVAGSYTYTLLNRDVNNCTVSATAIVNFIPEPSLTVINTSLCPLTTGTLTALGATSYTWENGSSGNIFTASPLTTISYSLIGSALGCTASASAFMILHPIPVPVLNSNSPVCNGQVLQMAGTGGSSYRWNGPLAFSSFVQSPLINPSNPNHSGVYNLTVTSVNGCTAATSASLTVNPTPTLSAAGSTVCVTGVITLNSNSVPGALYAWLGPIGYTSSIANPTYNYPTVNRSGFYTVTATSAQGCTNSAVAHVTVTALPIPFAGSDGPKCAGSVINFLGSGASSYAWAGPGGFLSNQQNPQITAVSMAAMGNYTLTATTGPCINTTTYALMVYPLPTPTASNSGPVCETKTLQLFAATGNTVSTYFWLGPNFSTSTKNPVRDSTKLSFSGVYTLTVQDQHMCQATAHTTVSILSNPMVTASGATVCLYASALLSANGASSYIWTGPAFFQSTKPNALIASVTLDRNGLYSVVGTAANSCTATTTVKVLTRSLPQPSLTLLPKSEICLNESITLNGKGGQKYEWYGPNDVYYEGQEVNFTATNLSAAGTYTLKVTDDKGCSASISTLITVYNLPNGSLMGSKLQGCVPLCSDFVFESSSIIPSRVLSSWDINGRNITGQTFNHCFTEVGLNLITGNLYDSSTTCTNKVDFYVHTFPKPEADFEFAPAKPVENSDEVIFTNTSRGEQQKMWNWSIGDSRIYKSTSQNTAYLFTEQGRYPVALIVRNTWGCSDSIIKTVIVEEDFHIYIPNVFTPNEDNRNELFLPIGRGVKTFHISIYDRWGAKIFESKDLASGWDGSYKGDPCKSDIYTWKIEVTSLHGENKVLTGHVTLIR
ncbi:MAG: gliding motility-associated C-terminal domain-containing protein [bacterium]|nr:gliding motility-associated C-terminal domain-containing protein [bacterium]